MASSQKDLLRFTTAGSVDDGKSTLIGRMLYDSKSIHDDQLETIKEQSGKTGDQEVNLALLTDGLRAEREQGITIDVAYRYFETAKRKFIIADTPGHIEYTRNMVTGASTANLAIVLVDARNGVVEQTHRHAFIASLLRIPHIVFCINKMDLVDYKEERYNELVKELSGFSNKLNVVDVRFIPISALNGDNVVDASKKMSWYKGGTLLYTLENIHVSGDYNHIDCRFPIQYVIRPQSKEFPDYRAYAGRIASGIFKKGDEVTLMPSGFKSKIASIDTMNGALAEAYAPMSVSIRLEDDMDLSRGDMLVRTNNQPNVGQEIDVMICWLNNTPLNAGNKYTLLHTSNESKCVVREIRYKIDVNTLHRVEDEEGLKMNDIARVSIRVAKPIFWDEYSRNRITGSLILVDPTTNNTVAAGMIL
ncbi:MAG: sulfate adenylyltransferase subunit 1 [Patiriisocius sp.]|jgi:sulfate adenylyltransferase subunit 1